MFLNCFQTLCSRSTQTIPMSGSTGPSVCCGDASESSEAFRTGLSGSVRGYDRPVRKALSRLQKERTIPARARIKAFAKIQPDLGVPQQTTFPKHRLFRHFH